MVVKQSNSNENKRAVSGSVSNWRSVQEREHNRRWSGAKWAATRLKEYVLGQCSSLETRLKARTLKAGAREAGGCVLDEALAAALRVNLLETFSLVPLAVPRDQHLHPK